MYAICYACDDNYSLQVGVSLLSLLKTNVLNNKAKIYVFSDNIKEENKNNLLKIASDYKQSLEFIDTTIIIDKIKKTGLISNVDNASLSTFVRIFIQDHIPQYYKNIIYIDADTIIIDDITELLENESDKPVAAVIDIMPVEYKKVLRFDNSLYFNCGVLRINMDRWREQKCEEKILEHISDCYNKYLYADQDVMNIVLKDNIDILPLRYNSFPFYGEVNYKLLRQYMGLDNKYYSKNEYEEAKNRPAIIHLVYSVVDRPWFEGNMNKYGKLWDSYVKQTPWKEYVKKSRKSYSRTRLLQIVYRYFGSKTVIDIQKKRNLRLYKAVEKQYTKDDLIL